MGVTKSQLFTAEQNRIAALAKALAHPARVAIVQYLTKTKDCVCGQIVDVLPLAQSTISQHLKELKNAGIIEGEINGVKTCYCINPEVWQELKLVFGHLFDQYDASCCK